MFSIRGFFALGAIVVATAMSMPGNASAIFPPVYHPYPTPTPPVVITTTRPEAPTVNTVGIPDPPVTATPPDIKTPEPATMVSASLAVLLGLGYARRKRRLVAG